MCDKGAYMAGEMATAAGGYAAYWNAFLFCHCNFLYGVNGNCSLNCKIAHPVIESNRNRNRNHVINRRCEWTLYILRSHSHWALSDTVSVNDTAKSIEYSFPVRSVNTNSTVWVKPSAFFVYCVTVWHRRFNIVQCWRCADSMSYQYIWLHNNFNRFDSETKPLKSRTQYRSSTVNSNSFVGSFPSK